MWTLLGTFVGTLRSLFRTQRELALENLALRQQVGVLIRTRGGRRLRLGVWDRALWVILSQAWAGWRGALAIVEPATVIRWHREGFRRFWIRRRRPRRLGRPRLGREVVTLIRRMAQANVKYFEYYNRTRCHLSLAGDAPQRRGVQGPELGEVVEFPEVGGLHHRYERGAA